MPFPALPSVQHTISSLPTQRTPIHPSKPTSVKSSLDSSPQLLTIFLPGRFYHLPAQKLVFGGVSSSACFSLKTGNSLVTKAAGSHLGAPPRPSGHMLRILRGQVPSTWSSSLQARRPPPTTCHHVCPTLKFLLLEPKSGLPVLRECGLPALKGWVAPLAPSPPSQPPSRSPSPESS